MCVCVCVCVCVFSETPVIKLKSFCDLQGCFLKNWTCQAIIKNFTLRVR